MIDTSNVFFSDVKIADMGLTPRTLRAINESNRLHGTNYQNVGDLIDASYSGISKIPGLGSRSLRELISVLRDLANEHDLDIPTDTPDEAVQIVIDIILREISMYEAHVYSTSAKIDKLESDLKMVREFNASITTKLDQFAMAALPALVGQRHLTGIESAAAAYNYAEAMLAESKKRQGGEV